MRYIGERKVRRRIVSYALFGLLCFIVTFGCLKINKSDVDPTTPAGFSLDWFVNGGNTTATTNNTCKLDSAKLDSCVLQ